MKKVILSLVLLTAVSAYATLPVPGAAYAVVTGAKGGQLVITKGSCFRIHGVINDSMNILTSGIQYFNYRSEVIPCPGDKPARLDELDLASDKFTTDFYEQTVKEIRAKLTDLPEVRTARLMLSNTAPERQSIQILDKDGRLITSTRFDKWGSFKIGSPLPEKAIQALREYVRNPQELSLLVISEIKER